MMLLLADSSLSPNKKNKIETQTNITKPKNKLIIKLNLSARMSSYWDWWNFSFSQVYNAGFSAPTPIQAQSWPIALQSRDIVAIAKTGSGKTVGYLFPGFMHLKRVNNDPRLGPTVLVLSPTRELATQIQEEAVKFGKSSRLSCVVCYFGLNAIFCFNFIII